MSTPRFLRGVLPALRLIRPTGLCGAGNVAGHRLPVAATDGRSRVGHEVRVPACRTPVCRGEAVDVLPLIALMTFRLSLAESSVELCSPVDRRNVAGVGELKAANERNCS